MNDRKLKVSLEEVIEKWISDQSENTAFDATVIGGKTAAYMADAAFAVIAGMHEAQEYGFENGDLCSCEEDDDGE